MKLPWISKKQHQKVLSDIYSHLDQFTTLVSEDKMTEVDYWKGYQRGINFGLRYGMQYVEELLTPTQPKGGDE